MARCRADRRQFWVVLETVVSGKDLLVAPRVKVRQAGAYRSASSSSSLRSHDSDWVGHVVYSPMQESGPAVPLEPRVEFSGTELVGSRHYHFSSG